jgi:hypothetical protein
VKQYQISSIGSLPSLQFRDRQLHGGFHLFFFILADIDEISAMSCISVESKGVTTARVVVHSDGWIPEGGIDESLTGFLHGIVGSDGLAPASIPGDFDSDARMLPFYPRSAFPHRTTHHSGRASNTNAHRMSMTVSLSVSKYYPHEAPTVTAVEMTSTTLPPRPPSNHHNPSPPLALVSPLYPHCPVVVGQVITLPPFKLAPTCVAAASIEGFGGTSGDGGWLPIKSLKDLMLVLQAVLQTGVMDCSSRLQLPIHPTGMSFHHTI